VSVPDPVPDPVPTSDQKTDAQAGSSATAADKESMVFSESGLRRRRAIRVGKVCLCLLLCTALIVAIWALATMSAAEDVESAQDTAFSTLQEMMHNGANDDDVDAFDSAFDTFDVDNDGALDEAEFASFFKRELSYSAEFERMDIDGDDAVSYPEAVVYVRQMSEIEAMRQYLVSDEDLSQDIANAFDFELDLSNSSLSEETWQLYFEYATMAMYFLTYDEDINGYINHEEFVNISVAQEWDTYAHYFDVAPDDESARVSRDAFYERLYGTDQYSWELALHEKFGSGAHYTEHEFAQLEIPSQEAVRSATIRLSPILLLRAS